MNLPQGNENPHLDSWEIISRISLLSNSPSGLWVKIMRLRENLRTNLNYSPICSETGTTVSRPDLDLVAILIGFGSDAQMLPKIKGKVTLAIEATVISNLHNR